MKRANKIVRGSSGQSAGHTRVGLKTGDSASLACLIAVVLAVVLASHWPVLSSQALSLDDNQFFAENPLVTHPSWASAWRFFSEVLEPSTVSGLNNYIPVTMTSLMVDHALGGRADNLRQFHRTNLVLHAANTTLIILLLHALFGQAWPAALAGLMFGVHPLTVEPVAWVAERKGLLAAFFALASLLAYVRFARVASRNWLWTTLGLYVLALLSKPTILVLPAMMLLFDFWPLGRLRLAALYEKLPLFAVAAVFAIITLLSHGRTAEIITQESRFRSASFETACYVLVFYLRKIVWPSNLCSVYLLPEPLSIANPAVLWSIVGVVFITGCTAISLRWTRTILAGMFFFLIGIAPTLGVVRYSWVTHHDKYLYLPAFGLLMILGWGLCKLWEFAPSRWLLRRESVAVLVLLISAGEIHGIRTYLPYWADSLTLYEYMARLAPGVAPVHNNLGEVYFKQHRLDEAVRQYHIALDNLPSYADSHYNLGIALAEKGGLAEAIGEFRRTEDLLPSDASVQYNLGFALYTAGRSDDAIIHLRRATELQPDHAKAHYIFGMALAASDRRSEALTHLLEATRLRPEAADMLNAVAWILATAPEASLRDPAQAVLLAERACELTYHKNAGGLDTLAAAYAAGGRFNEAKAAASAAIELLSRDAASKLTGDVRARLELYRQGKPFIEPARGPGGTGTTVR